MWPFSRKTKQKRARAEKGPADHAPHAPGAAVASGSRDASHDAPFLDEVDPAYRAPPGPEAYRWLRTAPRDYFVEGWLEMDPDGYEDYTKWPRAEAPKKAHAIRRRVLEMVLEASKAQFPQEFGAVLRAEKGVIEELVLLPGTLSGDSSAIFQFHMMPIDLDIVGTIHSHPSPIPYPSAADTELFERYGRVHIITGHPFTMGDWRAFNHRSERIELRVVD